MALPARVRSENSHAGSAKDAQRVGERIAADVHLRPRGSGPTESPGRAGQGGPRADERQSGRTNFWSQPRRPSSSLLLSH